MSDKQALTTSACKLAEELGLTREDLDGTVMALAVNMAREANAAPLRKQVEFSVDRSV